MDNSKTTIRESFLDFIWPAILEENICENENRNKTPYFNPHIKFDNLWAHSLLAAKCFGDYEKPLELGATNIKLKPQEEDNSTIEDFEQMSYRTPVPTIIPIDEQLINVQRDIVVRKKLAQDFAQRTFPWYIQRPEYISNFKTTDDMKFPFQNPFELEILQHIQHFQCKLMIVDVAIDMAPNEIERWLKFSPYVNIITVIHNANLYRKLTNFNDAFMATFLENNFENSWHEELNCSLTAGIQLAKDKHLFDNAGTAFVFVFASNRNYCSCDKFKILRQF
ncbi:uncharacterized protein LOC133335869 [Musca vetustissima]|uniref:uncharacterized protein LOC133335869 n=1 Tax=Musca vetustissima TaxID=27455 RepID=UPI002AB648E2|nr:uncharacterized protein LOC133335869 [Musca vetustissima]